MVAKYSNLVNGFDKIAITKLDVLDTFDEICIGVSYWLDGKKLDSMPGKNNNGHQMALQNL